MTADRAPIQPCKSNHRHPEPEENKGTAGPYGTDAAAPGAEKVRAVPADPSAVCAVSMCNVDGTDRERAQNAIRSLRQFHEI